jgi:hypothetical protein
LNRHGRTGIGDDQLIFLADALALVPFSETTLRRAIAKGELDAWRPNTDGKLVIWRSALLEWATRRPATDRAAAESRGNRRAAPDRRRTRRATGTPDAITLADLA